MIRDIFLKKITPSSKKQLKRGEFIYHQGDKPEKIYFVEKGLIGLFQVSEGGKETFLRTFGPGDIFGHRSYFANESYHANTVALTESSIDIIDELKCQEICFQHPDLLKHVTGMLAKDLGQAERRLSGFSDQSANARIVEALIYLKFKHPEQTWTRKEIAEYSVSTFESVARVMTKLNDNDLLTKNGRDYEIVDPAKLLSFSKQNF